MTKKCQVFPAEINHYFSVTTVAKFCHFSHYFFVTHWSWNTCFWKSLFEASNGIFASKMIQIAPVCLFYHVRKSQLSDFSHNYFLGLFYTSSEMTLSGWWDTHLISIATESNRTGLEILQGIHWRWFIQCNKVG